MDADKITSRLAFSMLCTVVGYLLIYFSFIYIIPSITGGEPVHLQDESWIYMVASNFGFAFWLYTENKKIIWTIAGLMFGINAVVLYYVTKNIQKN